MADASNPSPRRDEGGEDPGEGQSRGFFSRIIEALSPPEEHEPLLRPAQQHGLGNLRRMRVEEAHAPAGAPRCSFTGAAVLAGLAFAGDLFFWHLSILGTTVANATFFATTAPLFVVLMVWLGFRERVTSATLAGLTLCLLGGASLIGQSVDVAPERLRGDLFGIVTAVFFALYFLAVGRARRQAGAARVTF